MQAFMIKEKVETMATILQVVLLLCIIFFSLGITTTEDKRQESTGYCVDNVSYSDSVFTFQLLRAVFPSSLTGVDFVAKLHWIAEVWERYVPREIGYPLLYSTLAVAPLIPFLSILIPSEATLLQERERLERLAAEELEGEEYWEDAPLPETEQCCPLTGPRNIVRSRSESSIYGNSLDLRSASVYSSDGWTGMIRDEQLAHGRREVSAEIVAHEECPDLAAITSVDSYTLLKELGTRICTRSTLGKTCIAVTAGALVSYGIYRFLTK